MKVVFLETDTLGGDVDLSIFEEFCEVVKYNKSEPKADPIRAAEADILIVNKVPMNESTLSGAEQLKLICITGTGTNIVDFAYTGARNIAVANVKGYSTSSVVQHTFALLFYVYEKLQFYDNFVKSGDYARSDIFSRFDIKFNELFGKTWGIIGLGDIGRGVADIAKAFGCQVIYYSTSGKNVNTDYKQVDFDTLLRTSDIISIHAPLNSDTENLIDKEAFTRMKDTAVLLNLGRGPIVNEEALAEALENDRIAAAGLDVINVEPMSPDNPLLRIQDSKKLIITPHIAWATVEARTRCVQDVYENIKAYMRGEERNIVK
jgi:glycerate dehydrogenase